MEKLEHSELLEALDYNPLTGIFTWRSDRPLSHFKNESAKKVYLGKLAGKQAGHKCKPANSDITYVQIRLFTKLYLAHRLAVFYMTGNWPSGIIDHINGNGLDNSMPNLRDVDDTINNRNCKLSSNNTSGVNGVYWNKANRNWVAEGHYTEGGVNKKVSLGSFADLEDARLAREGWEKSQGNFTQRHGKEERSSLLANIT